MPINEDGSFDLVAINSWHLNTVVENRKKTGRKQKNEKRRCPICSRVFVCVPSSSKQFCSLQCSNKSKRKRKKCQECRRELMKHNRVYRSTHRKDLIGYCRDCYRQVLERDRQRKKNLHISKGSGEHSQRIRQYSFLEANGLYIFQMRGKLYSHSKISKILKIPSSITLNFIQMRFGTSDPFRLNVLKLFNEGTSCKQIAHLLHVGDSHVVSIVKSEGHHDPWGEYYKNHVLELSDEYIAKKCLRQFDPNSITKEMIEIKREVVTAQRESKIIREELNGLIRSRDSRTSERTEEA